MVISRLLPLCFAACLLAAPLAHSEIKPMFWKGGDISFIPQIESEGVMYLSDKRRIDPVTVFANHGWTIARLRVWVDPRDGWCGRDQTFAMAKRIVKSGMKLAIDFHYSDNWADPGKQYAPKAWKDLNHEDLVKRVRGYTASFVQGLITQGTPPYAVQIGNEITAGMISPDRKLDGSDAQWAKFADLVKAGIQGVRDVEGSHPIIVAIHIDRGGDNGGTRWFFDHLTKYDVRFDAIGLSYYFWWHGPLAKLEENLKDTASRYGKPVYVAETMYPFSLEGTKKQDHWAYSTEQTDPRFPASRAGQADYLMSLVSLEASLPQNRGLGVLYWAPEAIDDPVRKNQAFDNVILFDKTSNPTSGVDALGGNFGIFLQGSRPHSGTQVNGKVVLCATPKLSDTVVSLESSQPTLLKVPKTVTIKSGTTEATFEAAAAKVKKPTLIRIRAKFADRTRTATVLVTPK